MSVNRGQASTASVSCNLPISASKWTGKSGGLHTIPTTKGAATEFKSITIKSHLFLTTFGAVTAKRHARYGLKQY